MAAIPQIELATVDDAVAIGEMSQVDIEYGLPWRWTPPRIVRAIENSSTNVAVARDQAGLVAFGIMKYKDDLAHLLLFDVRKARRRSGVGSALLAWLEDVARTAGIATIRVEARADNAAARAFYQKHGYREVSNVLGMYSGIEDGVGLEKAFFDVRRLGSNTAMRDGAQMQMKEIVKDNHVRFLRHRHGQMYCSISVPGRSVEYMFPVPLREVGDATPGSTQKAVMFMQYIRKAMEEGTFVPVSFVR